MKNKIKMLPVIISMFSLLIASCSSESNSVEKNKSDLNNIENVNDLPLPNYIDIMKINYDSDIFFSRVKKELPPEDFDKLSKYLQLREYMESSTGDYTIYGEKTVTEAINRIDDINKAKSALNNDNSNDVVEVNNIEIVNVEEKVSNYNAKPTRNIKNDNQPNNNYEQEINNNQVQDTYYNNNNVNYDNVNQSESEDTGSTMDMKKVKKEMIIDDENNDDNNKKNNKKKKKNIKESD